MLGNVQASADHIWPGAHEEFDQAWPDFGQNYLGTDGGLTERGQIYPESARSGAILTERSTMLDKFARTRAKSPQIRPIANQIRLGRPGPKSGKILPKPCESWHQAKFGQNGPRVGHVMANSAELYQKACDVESMLAEIEPNSAHLYGRPSDLLTAHPIRVALGNSSLMPALLVSILGGCRFKDLVRLRANYIRDRQRALVN